MVPIPQGNPILFSMLAPENTAAGLSGILADGKRPLTVKVDEVAGVGGFITGGTMWISSWWIWPWGTPRNTYPRSSCTIYAV